MKLNKKWYSVVIALLLVWFILILSTGIFRLILNEMKSNRAMWDYMKSIAWAEAAQELALLDIKTYWYWYAWKIDDDINAKSVILSEDPLDSSLFNWNKDVLISYSNNAKVNSYEGTLDKLWYDIIPLFYIDENGEHAISDLYFNIINWDSSELSWNIVWSSTWISWTWNDLTWVTKTLTSDWFTYNHWSIWEFLSNSSTNYLVLFNWWRTSQMTYSLSSVDQWEYFTTPSMDIISSGKVSKYKQNLRTSINNTEFLNILKYSIYSN